MLPISLLRSHLAPALAALLSGRNWLRDQGSPKAEAMLASPPQLEFVPLCSASCYLGSGEPEAAIQGQEVNGNSLATGAPAPSSPRVTHPYRREVRETTRTK